MLDHIRIVLVNPTHPGNIGAAARAMKAMGLADLCLVEPKEFPSGIATALASGADDILDNAKIVSSVEEAISDCHYVVGTSARIRGISLPLGSPRSCSVRMIEEAVAGNKVAILFGREDRGLTNEELQHCQVQIHIPTDEHFSSLNLSQAVQVICYELRMSALEIHGGVAMPKVKSHELVSVDDMEHYYAHLYETLIEIGFLDHSSHQKIMAKLRRLYGRIRPDSVELAILRGILSETQRIAKKDKE
ncbi:tRNA (cytidine/uridine-2'-O-)-methyltransferase TrmJ [invertebrate metagenome]|uniref:tRNA (Cytidine/uridine-2'-O-)-methyltransferase TrmJ n=1 Tax=invertebrate metagenome TaxID=1711999 RepID=A0A2H9T828_9ZZZZ